MENWGNTYYEFVDQWGNPVIVTSNGVEAVGGGIYYDDLGNPYPIALAGPVIDCYNSELTYGVIDWNWNGIVDPGEELASVEGDVNYSGGTLTIYNLVLEGVPLEDIVATCVGPGVFSADIVIQEDRGFPATLLHELTRILSIRY